MAGKASNQQHNVLQATGDVQNTACSQPESA
jgi:hypothetical protein